MLYKYKFQNFYHHYENFGSTGLAAIMRSRVMTRESSKMMAPVTSPKYWEFQNNNRGQINCVTQLVVIRGAGNEPCFASITHYS